MAQRNTESHVRVTQAERPKISTVQVVLATIFAVGLMLAISFTTRLVEDRQLLQIRDHILQEIDILESEQRDLTAELAYVQSEIYVAQWARSDGKMVREGDVLVIPIFPEPEEEPAVAENPEIVSVQQEDFSSVIETAPPKPETWEIWWSLFFDTNQES